MELFTIGFATALTPENLLFCFGGVLLGTFVGVLPGIGSLAAVSMLLPITFYVEPTTALIMLAGVYYGAEYGGSTSSILLNLPGTASNAVTCLDGYPMAQQGRAGVALFATTMASFIGGSIGILILMLLTPVMVAIGLSFGAAEYFAVMIFGLLAAASMTSDAPIKGVAMVVLGLLLGSIGADVASGVPRFTFGLYQLYDGVSIVIIAMGLFGVAEVIASAGKARVTKVANVSLRSMIPTRDDVKRSFFPTLRGTGIGAVLGALPATGPTLSAFVSYAVEKRVARDPSRFGKGAIEGVASPEASNNAAVQTAFIPTLSLGIPGTATMAIMLGALMIHGINPGPSLMIRHPELFWGLVASFWIGNVILLILNIPLIGIWVRLLQIPYRYLFPVVVALICIGVYSINNSMMDVWLMLGFGFVGYGMRLLRFEPAPLLIGFMLGPLIEENFRRAMLIGRGDVMFLFNRPISGTLLVLAMLIIAWVIWTMVRPRRKKVVEAAE